MPGSPAKMEAMPTASETAPPGRPAISTSTRRDSSFTLEVGKPIAASASADSSVLIAK